MFVLQMTSSSSSSFTTTTTGRTTVVSRNHYEVRYVAPELHPSISPDDTTTYTDYYPVPLMDGSYIELPIQPLADSTNKKAIALLMSNQTSFNVEDKISQLLSHITESFHPETIVGIPTLGLVYASQVAKRLHKEDYVALGNSRKFWYDDAYSMEITASSTSPEMTKRLYIDPALLPRVVGKRVVIVDDVINTGTTMMAAIQLLQNVGAIIVGIVVVLTEGYDWEQQIPHTVSIKCINEKQQTEKLGSDETIPDHFIPLKSLGHIPIFQNYNNQGWKAIPET